METQQIIEIIKATAGSVDHLITQLAFFMAITAAAHWLSFTLPLLLVGGIFLRISKSEAALPNGNTAVSGSLIIVAWLGFGLAIFTGVRGVAPVLQAALAPSIYVATEVGGVDKLKELMEKK